MRTGVQEANDATLLHYEADFDLIAEVTGQAVEWVVPRGSVDRAAGLHGRASAADELRGHLVRRGLQAGEVADHPYP